MVMHNSVHMAKVTENFKPHKVHTEKRQIKMQRNFYTTNSPN